MGLKIDSKKGDQSKSIAKTFGQSFMMKLSGGILSSVILSLAIASPSFSQNTVSLGRNFRPDPVALQGNSSGTASIAEIAGIADNCRGFANAKPNHTITLRENFPVMDMLVYSSNINDDPTMLIKGPNGIVICADDESGGRNPQVTRRLPKGNYQVWIGSKNINQSFRYTLSLSEIRQK
ncbi:hypothetical protein H6F42_03500 [Pseudanabaena sp. FACHB-1998]|nr:hypothetical protein [Pseudanabaena sp. FACHB-1998]